MSKSIVCALMIGRKGSVGFPGKNVYPVLGRPLAAYPLLAAKDSTHIERIFVSTDSPELMTIAQEHGAELIERPPELASKEALGEDAFDHGYNEIKRRLKKEGLDIELVVLLFANGATLFLDEIGDLFGIESFGDDSLEAYVARLRAKTGLVTQRNRSMLPGRGSDQDESEGLATRS